MGMGTRCKEGSLESGLGQVPVLSKGSACDALVQCFFLSSIGATSLPRATET